MYNGFRLAAAAKQQYDLFIAGGKEHSILKTE